MAIARSLAVETVLVPAAPARVLSAGKKTANSNATNVTIATAKSVTMLFVNDLCMIASK